MDSNFLMVGGNVSFHCSLKHSKRKYSFCGMVIMLSSDLKSRINIIKLFSFEESKLLIL